MKLRNMINVVILDLLKLPQLALGPLIILLVEARVHFEQAAEIVVVIADGLLRAQLEARVRKALRGHERERVVVLHHRQLDDRTVAQRLFPLFVVRLSLPH